MTYAITHGLGRFPSPDDPRDWGFPKLTAMIDAGVAVPVAWDTSVILDQGRTSRCVGYSIATLCATAAENCPGDSTVTNALGDAIYKRACEIAGHPGSEEGTYLRAGLKAAQEMGLIDHYARGDWATATDFVRRYGATVLGIPWKSDMFHPDTKGVIRATGTTEGGHAICWSMDAQVPADNGLPNTWSRRWGVDGRCYIPDPDLFDLIEAGGEVWTVVKYAAVLPHWTDLDPMNDDDLLSQDKVWRTGVMKGYTATLFKPGIPMTQRQVGAVMVRLGLKSKNPWEHEWTKIGTRGWVHKEFPQLTFNDTYKPWSDPVNRFQMLVLTGRFQRGL